jgi:site-specific DNA-methyltransferase (cytosine-N4-specific)|tara:strand:+ start:156 stop:1301 length:1146 start_codon:yes stop_codon:yes gene_type:complete
MTVKIYTGDCLEVLDKLEDDSIDCCVTSPSYWGLRDYGTATWVGGDPNCSHKRDSKFSENTSTGQKNLEGAIGDGIYKTVCKRCGAVREDKQIGLEEHPFEYVKKMGDVFDKVKRVLKPEGTLWLNLGDSYIGGGRGWEYCKDGTVQQQRVDAGVRYGNPTGKVDGFKAKDKAGIPHRVAFELQDRGWWYRSEIIWAKNNPTPESVTDRPTTAHEQVFLMSKSKKYYYDQDSIREPHTWQESTPKPTEEKREGKKYKDKKDYAGGGTGLLGHSGTNKADGTPINHPLGKNKRTVWNVNPRPFPESHFAVFPPELIKPMILAGCPEGGTVLDPFGGAGTTGLVANQLDRNAVLIELNPDYVDIIEKRLGNDAPLFSDIQINK